MLIQPLRNRQRVGAVLFYPQRKRANTAQRQEAAERIQYAAHRVLQIAQLIRQFLVVPDNRQPGHHVGMTVEVFGGGVHHDIETRLQRTVDHR